MRSTFARYGLDFAAGAALSQGEVQTSWQAQYFRKVRCGGRQAPPMMFEEVMIQQRVMIGIESKLLHFVACAALSQGQAQISWQAQHFPKARYASAGRGIDFAAGAALSQGEVQTSWQAQYFRKARCTFVRQAQHFRKVLCRFHGRRSAFARTGRCSTFAPRQAQHFRKVRLLRGRRSAFAGGLGGGRPPHDARRCDDSARGALISVNIPQTSRGVGGGRQPPHDVRRSDASTKGDDDRRMFEEAVSTKGVDDRRSDDSTKGPLSSVNILKISGGVGGGGGCRPPLDVRRCDDSTKGAFSSVSVLHISRG